MNLAKTLLILLLLQGFFSTPYVFADNAKAHQKPLAIGTGLPQFKTFIEKVGGHRVLVVNLLAKGDSAHSYTPSPKTLTQVMRSDIYFSSGLVFEERIISKLSSSHSGPLFVNLSKKLPLIEADDCGCSTHLVSTPHTHNKTSHNLTMDLHTWLNPVNVMTICINIKETLSKTDPKNKRLYSENCLRYIKKLKETDNSIQEIFKPYRNKPFYVYHPSLGYFAKRYNIKQVAIEIAGREPSGRQLTTLIRQTKKNGVHTIFVQKGFPLSAAKRLAMTIDGKVEFIDPLATDYSNNLLSIANLVSNSMK